MPKNVQLLVALVVLGSFGALAAPLAGPFSCFTENAAAQKQPNTCFGQYPLKFPAITEPEDCATQCLNDTACVQFVWALPAESGPRCRISHTCAKPTEFLAGFDGYERISSTAGCAPSPTPPATLSFHAPLFADGMVLQRDQATNVWGSGAAPNSKVTVSVQHPAASSSASVAVILRSSAQANAQGDWTTTVTVAAANSTTLTATDGHSTVTLNDVAFGDVILCGGQSNMGFGMCGATSKTQTPQQALDALSPRVRYFFEQGSGPNGGRGGCATTSGQPSITVAHQWLRSNATNAGGFSAICMLTAQALLQSLDGVPVGAVESCVSGTNVEPWTPPSGSLYVQDIEPLLPMTFKAALWDQGEADAKRTSSKYYTTEFPTLITGWRQAFESPQLPFFYVELCTEYGADEPKETSFWLAQRAALKLPFTGFAVTTDIQRALHPPDKQDVSARLLLEIQRVAYGQPVVARGPELLGTTQTADGALVISFTNSSLVTREGIFVGKPGVCTSPFLVEVAGGQRTPANYTINGNKVTVQCAGGNTSMVLVNADSADCFLYSAESKLPAPPISVQCS